MSGSSVDSHAGRTVEDHPAVLRLLGKRHLDMIAGRTRVVCRLIIRIWNWPRAPAEHSSFESVQVSSIRGWARSLLSTTTVARLRGPKSST